MERRTRGREGENGITVIGVQHGLARVRDVVWELDSKSNPGPAVSQRCINTDLVRHTKDTLLNGVKS